MSDRQPLVLCSLLDCRSHWSLHPAEGAAVTGAEDGSDREGELIPPCIETASTFNLPRNTQFSRPISPASGTSGASALHCLWIFCRDERLLSSDIPRTTWNVLWFALPIECLEEMADVQAEIAMTGRKSCVGRKSQCPTTPRNLLVCVSSRLSSSLDQRLRRLYWVGSGIESPRIRLPGTDLKSQSRDCMFSKSSCTCSCRKAQRNVGNKRQCGIPGELFQYRHCRLSR